MNKQQLAEFESLLLKLKTETIANDIDITRMKSEKITEDYEAASQITDQTLLTALLTRKTLYLKKIEQALVRVYDGTYGECDQCGDDINPKRLKAWLTATFCVACKETHEKNQKNTTKHFGILDWEAVSDG